MMNNEQKRTHQVLFLKVINIRTNQQGIMSSGRSLWRIVRARRANQPRTVASTMAYRERMGFGNGSSVRTCTGATRPTHRCLFFAARFLCRSCAAIFLGYSRRKRFSSSMEKSRCRVARFGRNKPRTTKRYTVGFDRLRYCAAGLSFSAPKV